MKLLWASCHDNGGFMSFVEGEIEHEKKGAIMMSSGFKMSSLEHTRCHRSMKFILSGKDDLMRILRGVWTPVCYSSAASTDSTQ